MNDHSRIEALWFEKGTAADAAAATNMHRADDNKISAQGVREIWERAREEGRLPPFDRPLNGFPAGPSSILKELQAQVGRAA